LFLLSCFASAVADAAKLDVSAAESGCRTQQLDLRHSGAELSLSLLPDHDYSIWVDEAGVDALWAAGDGLFVGSEPRRHGSTPLQARSDGRGNLVLGLRLTAQERGGSLRLRLRCITSLTEPERRRHRQAVRIAALATTYRHDAEPRIALLALVLTIRALSEPGLDAGLRGWLWFQLAGLARDAGLLDEAAAAFALADAAAQASGATRQAIAARYQIALSALSTRPPDVAGALLAAVEQHSREAGLTYFAALAHHDRCVVQRMTGDVIGAVRCLDGSAREFERMGQAAEASLALRNRSTALLLLGRYAEARAALEGATRFAKRSGDSRRLALTAPLRAQLATWAGEFETALGLLHEAQTALGKGGAYTLQRILLQRQLAGTYALAGQTRRAMDYYERALGDYLQRGMSMRAAEVRTTLARLLEQQAQPDLALAQLAAARADLARAGGGTLEQEARITLAWVRLAAPRDPDAARAALREVAPEVLDQFQTLAVEAALLRLRLDGAIDLAQIEAQLQPMLTAAVQGGHVLRYLDIAQALVQARASAERRDAAALAGAALRFGMQVAARLRSPALRHAVLTRLRPLAAHPLLQWRDGALDEDTARDHLDAWLALRGLERIPAPAMPGDALDELERRLAEELLAVPNPMRTQSRNALMLALEAGVGASNIYSASGIPSDQGVRWRPGADEVLLLMVAGAEQAVMLRQDEAGWKAFPGIDVRAVQDGVSRLRHTLADGHADAVALDSALIDLARALRWKELTLGAPRRIYVMADGDLIGLPWELLPAPGNATGAVGSISEVVLLQSLHPQPVTRPRAIAALGAMAPGGGPLVALAHDEELATVRAAWSNHPVTTLPRADRVVLERVLADIGNLVHIGAHGRGDLGYSEDAGLWLAAADGTPQFVSALRLRRLPVNATMVVLSACDSGYGVVDRSLGAGGVAGALVDAGADAVIATRWPVSDRTALAFSHALHHALAKTPADPASALHAARKALQRKASFRHPTHWAGWFLLQAGPPRRD